MMLQPSRDIPVFKLYGEGAAWPTPDLLHCESISSRSQRHGWEIDQHRHADLYQLLYVRRGPATLFIEEHCTPVAVPVIQVVPAMCVHGFQFHDSIDGYIITLAAPLVAWLQECLANCPPLLQQPGCYAADAELDALFLAIAREYATPAAGRDVLLRSLMCALVVLLSRQLPQVAASEDRPDRGQPQLVKFSALVEQHYAAHWPVSRYARQLGVTSAYLNSVCRRLTGHSALQIVHQRQLLEAKRNLIYTVLTVSQIADVLGFAEPAYFIRFFRRLTGVTPRVFRQRGGVVPALPATAAKRHNGGSAPASEHTS
ncbi:MULTISPECIES: helix-turn-helix domain-containing protein [Vogesella]|nr:MULTISPECIES: helix-turn-helix domain-containing protein [Vogesella]MDC7697128.1 helix-turn-helix domain-containing protein [Vogesella indigofera]